MQKTPLPKSQWKESICATCEYWGGERDLFFLFRKLIHLQVQMTPRVKCTGTLQNTCLSPQKRACRSYKRWHKLP